MRKIIHALVILTPFIAVYAAHLGLIAIGVTARTAVGLMVLVMGPMLIALIAVIDTMRNDMKIYMNRRFMNQGQVQRNQINK